MIGDFSSLIIYTWSGAILYFHHQHTVPSYFFINLVHITHALIGCVTVLGYVHTWCLSTVPASTILAGH